MIEVEIVNHPTSTNHKVYKVITAKGRVYGCTWAEPFPTVEEVIHMWRENRKAFHPYDESVEVYVGQASF